MSQIIMARDLGTLHFISNEIYMSQKFNKNKIDEKIKNNNDFQNLKNMSNIYRKRNGLILLDTFSTSGCFSGRLKENDFGNN